MSDHYDYDDDIDETKAWNVKEMKNAISGVKLGM